MITEDYVSFKTAKLLKEKGFDEKCFTVYNNDREFYDTKYGIVPSIKIPTPTIQMAMKWLYGGLLKYTIF